MTATDTNSIPATIGLDAVGDRYRLHRAGIRNVWQYDDTVFDFADGRLLLRGKNGAGKSKALEMLLPFLLDGNTRMLDAVGQRDRTTLAWLMSDGRPPGNHVGYVWVELRGVGIDGSERFLTLGCGIKVSSSTQRTDTWYFVTDLRVGDDLPLTVGQTPWTAEKLRAAVGAENVLDAASYRARIRSVLFGGVEDGRYGNLLHLLHRLRQPNIGDRIDRNELPSLLAESLPPIDPVTLEDVAQNLDDLDDIRDQVRRAGETAAALSEFLGGYTGYARTQLRGRAAEVARAHEHLVTRREQGAAALAALDGAERERSAAEGAETKLTEKANTASAEIGAITSSEAYKSLAELDDRRALVTHTRSSGDALAAAAESARRREATSAKALAASAKETVEHATRTSSARADLVRALAAAGLDGGTIGDDPTVVVTPTADADDVLPGLDEDLVVIRPGIPTITTSGDMQGAKRLDAVSQMVAAARRATEAVQHKGIEAGKARTAAERADARADELEGAVTDAVEHLAETEAAVTSAAAALYDDVVTWADIADETSPEDAHRWANVRDLDTAQLDGTAARGTLDGLRLAVGEATSRAAGVAATTDAELTKRRGEHAALVTERDATAAQPVIDPAGPAYRTAGLAGAPLFSLIDFRDDIADDDRAGLEAALEASGLLTAWVTPGGTVTVAGDDVWARPAPRTTGRTAAEVLIPAAANDAVPTTTIADVLASIALDDADAESMIATDGRWRLGVLHGRWTKNTAEFVGAGARAAHRQRILDALDLRIADADLDVAIAREAVEAAEARRDAIAGLASQLPSEATLVSAEAQREAAQSQHIKARQQHSAAAETTRSLTEVAVRAERDFHEAATSEHLPADVDRLAARLSELARIPNLVTAAAGEHRALAGQLRRWTDAVSSFEALVAERDEAEHAADVALADHRTAAQAFAALEASVGATGDEVRAALTAAQDKLDAANKKLPQATKRHHNAIGAVATAKSKLDGCIEDTAAAEAAVSESVEFLRRVAAVDGFARAAFGAGTDTAVAEIAQTADADRLAALLARRAAGPGVTDNAILGRYDDLLHNLPGGYDVAPSEEQGVKVFTLQDADGAHPIAVVADRLIADAAEAANRLTAREQEVFQKFLLGNLGDAIRHHMQDATELINNMNKVLAEVRTSHGLGVRLDWNLRDDAASPTATAKELLLVAGEIRSTAQNDELHRALQDLIDDARTKEPSADYRKLLSDALDYRSWHAFAVRVIDDANPGRRQTLGPRAKLSQGEQRVLAYLTLFSAAAAQFTTIGHAAPTSPRLILLDDAFAKVDEPTHGRLLELLVDLDLDFIITSERLWGMFPGVPSLAIYECLRDPHIPGVATVEFRWDGHDRHLVGL